MGERTEIGWTDATFNGWWGCERVSPACDHCYAESLAKRYGHDVWGEHADRRFFGDKHWNEPLRWNRQAAAAGVPMRVFCSSMADVFEDRRDLDPWRARLWDLIERTPNLRWQLLTKRPQHVLDLVPESWRLTEFPTNVWVGTTVEDQPHVNVRMRRLAELRDHVRVLFVSYEPALGSVKLRYWLQLGTIDWLICGGESGPGARPMRPEWARAVRDECATAGVPYFFKQWGQHGPDMIRLRSKKDAGKLLDGVEHCAVPPLGEIVVPA